MLIRRRLGALGGAWLTIVTHRPTRRSDALSGARRDQEHRITSTDLVELARAGVSIDRNVRAGARHSQLGPSALSPGKANSYAQVMTAETAKTPQRIFVEDYVDLSLPFGTVRSRCNKATLWVSSDLASAAEEDGETLRLQIGPSWARGRVTREVEVILGPMRVRGDGCVLPLTWKATERRNLFPVLEGDLEIAPLGSDQCRLTLCAAYLPPFGDLGRTLDRVLLHRVAQSTLRSFLSRVAASLYLTAAPATASTSNAEPPGCSR